MSTKKTDSAEQRMEGGRLEAFSDGVIAVIITIMVLELKAPASGDFGELLSRWHTFAAYAVSFTMVAIYWVNHHHLLHVARRIGAPTLWINMLWLFALSLYPFTTSYVGETKGAPLALALYAGVAAVTAAAYALLAYELGRRNDHVELLRQVRRKRRLMSLAAIALDLLAIPVAYVSAPAAVLLLVAPALMYFMPERDVE